MRKIREKNIRRLIVDFGPVVAAGLTLVLLAFWGISPGGFSPSGFGLPIAASADSVRAEWFEPSPAAPDFLPGANPFQYSGAGPFRNSDFVPRTATPVHLRVGTFELARLEGERRRRSRLVASLERLEALAASIEIEKRAADIPASRVVKKAKKPGNVSARRMKTGGVCSGPVAIVFTQLYFLKPESTGGVLPLRAARGGPELRRFPGYFNSRNYYSIRNGYVRRGAGFKTIPAEYDPAFRSRLPGVFSEYHLRSNYGLVS